MKQKGFTLIELLVVVAIIGVLAAVGVVAYNGYTSGAKKAVVKQNFKTTVKAMKAEIMKCEIDSSEEVFGLPCPVQANTDYQACAAIYLSWKYNIRNPLVPNEGSKSGTINKCGGVDRSGTARGGIRSGDNQQDGDVNIVVCPRSPYCGNEAAGKFKVMWWWDNNTMQDSSVIDTLT